MKWITILLATMLLMTFTISCTSTTTERLGTSMPTKEERGYSTPEDHLLAVRQLDQKAQHLESDVARLVGKAEVLLAKPYLDPKGLQRNSLKRVVRARLLELRSLRNQREWHRAEASRLGRSLILRLRVL